MRTNRNENAFEEEEIDISLSQPQQQPASQEEDYDFISSQMRTLYQRLTLEVSSSDNSLVESAMVVLTNLQSPEFIEICFPPADSSQEQVSSDKDLIDEILKKLMLIRNIDVELQMNPQQMKQDQQQIFLLTAGLRNLLELGF